MSSIKATLDEFNFSLPESALYFGHLITRLAIDAMFFGIAKFWPPNAVFRSERGLVSRFFPGKFVQTCYFRSS